MRNYLAIITLIFLSTPVYAIGPYIGIGIGNAASMDASSNVHSNMGFLTSFGVDISNNNQDVYPGTYNDKSFAFSTLVGLQITPFIAFEGSYEHLGTYKFNDLFASNFLGSGNVHGELFTSGSVAGTLQDSVNVISLAGVLSLPVTPLLSIYAKGGIAESFDDMNCSSIEFGCATSYDYTKKVGAIIGGGVKVRFGPFSSLRLDISDYPDVGDKPYNYTAGNFIAVTAQYIFGF